MSNAPVTLSQALAAFTDIYSPRIVGRVNDYDVRIAHVRGDHLWHVHETTDEFFLVLDGNFDVSLREGGLVRTVSLHGGDIFVVPAGTEHKPSSSGGSILMFEPSGTLSTGDRHEGEIPAHVDSTTGHDIADEHPEAEHVAEDAAVPPLVAAATQRAREAGFPYSCERRPVSMCGIAGSVRGYDLQAELWRHSQHAGKLGKLRRKHVASMVTEELNDGVGVLVSARGFPSWHARLRPAWCDPIRVRRVAPSGRVSL